MTYPKPASRSDFRPLTIRRGIATGLALFFALACGTACLADIRPESLTESNGTAAAREQGITVLRASLQATGLKAWQKHTTASIEVRDQWNGLMGKLAAPWPENPQQFRQDMVLGTFSSRLIFLDGAAKGTAWGIQDWQTYEVANENANPRFAADDNIKFILPTIQYFFEFPFRIDSAPIIEHAGVASHEGVTYDLVLATWGSRAANAKYDQYIIWIDQDEKLIRKLRYTVRDSAGFITGTMHYGDYRSVAGVQIPHRQTVTLDAPEDVATADLANDNLHELRIQKVEFDRFKPEKILARQNLNSGGDYKN